MMKVAVIPARGGSKRIPKKNIKQFYGQPMIAYSIQAAIESQCFDKIMVSTDDQEIAEISLDYGAEVPFIRPAELANDFTGTIPVIKHAIDFMETELQQIPDYVCCIYATAPFILSADIKRAFEILSSDDCSYVFPVTTYPFPIQRAVKLNRDSRIEMFQPEAFSLRSQDLEEAYHDAGQFYWGKRDAWVKESVIFSSDSKPIILPRYQVQDIDTLEDWESAELMYESITKRGRLK